MLTGTTLVPGWTDEDRAWALGLSLRESMLCPHGHDLAESADYEAWRWDAADPLICWACVAQNSAIERSAKHPYHRSMLHAVHKRPRPKRPKPKRR